MIVISICAEDLKPHLKKSDKNNKHYVSIVVDERQTPDNYGNTHTAYISQSKEQRVAKEPKQYVGSGKEFKFSNETKPTTSKESQKDENDFSNLPF